MMQRKGMYRKRERVFLWYAIYVFSSQASLRLLAKLMDVSVRSVLALPFHHSAWKVPERRNKNLFLESFKQHSSPVANELLYVLKREMSDSAIGL